MSTPVQGEAMNEFAAWIQSNWYVLGNLFIQLAFLAAGVWFARIILRTIRASQEQVGALLKLSVTGTTAERHSSSAAADRPFANASPYWLAPSEIPSVSTPEFRGIGSSRRGVCHSKIKWLRPPLSSGRAHPRAQELPGTPPP